MYIHPRGDGRFSPLILDTSLPLNFYKSRPPQPPQPPQPRSIIFTPPPPPPSLRNTNTTTPSLVNRHPIAPPSHQSFSRAVARSTNPLSNRTRAPCLQTSRTILLIVQQSLALIPTTPRRLATMDVMQRFVRGFAATNNRDDLVVVIIQLIRSKAMRPLMKATDVSSSSYC
jgi:hypothetical protein